MALSYSRLKCLIFRPLVASVSVRFNSNETQRVKQTNLAAIRSEERSKQRLQENADQEKKDRLAYVPPEEKEHLSALQLFSSEYNIGINVITLLNSIQFTPYGLKHFWSERKWSRLLMSQAYVPERAAFLGPELAAAHFVCFRGGKVRFHSQPDWVVKDPEDDYMANLPRFFDPSYKMEALDCSKMTLVYEGLQNIQNLDNLKWLSLEGCQYVDDWFLDRIVAYFNHSLEYLNIRDCPLVTESGIASLCRIRTLKTLHLGGQLQAKNMELVCLMLEDVLPQIEIRGIVYCDPSFLLANNETMQSTISSTD